MRFILLLIMVGVLLPMSIQAGPLSDAGSRSFAYRGYTGGMMLHTGYVSSGSFSLYRLDGTLLGEQQIKGMPRGIGGLIRFHFGNDINQLRLGTEGYTSTVKYSSLYSYEKMGWGGLLMDYKHHYDNSRISSFVGATIGGGGIKNHIYIEADETDYQIETSGVFRKYAFICVTPFVGLEWAMTEKMLLTFKGDYLINLSNRQQDFVKGIRLYIGMVFNRAK